MTLSENQKPILESEIILPQTTKDPIYALCVRNNIETEEALLDIYATGVTLCKHSRSSLQLDGVVDLLHYQRLGDTSSELLSILKNPVDFDSPCYAQFHSKSFSRLGLFDEQRKYLASCCLKNRQSVSDNELIQFIDLAYQKLIENSYPFAYKVYKNTLCKFKLMLNMYRSTFGEKKESSPINKGEQAVQEEFARIRREAKLNMEKKV